MNYTVLLVLWQPGCCRWLLPFKGSHVCVGMRVLQAHAASVCKVAPRLQAHGFGFPLQLHTTFHIILTMLLLLKPLLLRRPSLLTCECLSRGRHPAPPFLRTVPRSHSDLQLKLAPAIGCCYHLRCCCCYRQQCCCCRPLRRQWAVLSHR